MNSLANHTGTKICKKCYNNILTSYLFVTRTYLVRNKLESCITYMLKNLAKIIEPQKNLCIEISQNFIMPEVDINIVKCFEAEETKIEVLEDEFRMDDDSESDEEIVSIKNNVDFKNNDILGVKSYVESRVNDSVELNKVNFVKAKTLNGYQKDVSEFLTFKKKKPIRIKYTCPLCSKHFVSAYFLKRHILKHGNNKVFCNSCDIKFNSKFGLFEHIKIMHSKKEVNDCWTCNICERIFTNHRKFFVHRKQHSHRICHLCDKVYKSQYFYNNHMQRHLKNLRYIKEKLKQTCSFCEKECSNDNELSLHVNKVHLQIKPYVCDMCDQQFYTEHNLRCHKKVHNLYCREKCSFCSKMLNSRAKFVVHLRRHIGVKPFTCQICYEAFISEIKLKKHLRVHLGNFR